jgi:hypothetical protein
MQVKVMRPAQVAARIVCVGARAGAGRHDRKQARNKSFTQAQQTLGCGPIAAVW